MDPRNMETNNLKYYPSRLAIKLLKGQIKMCMIIKKIYIYLKNLV